MKTHLWRLRNISGNPRPMAAVSLLLLLSAAACLAYDVNYPDPIQPVLDAAVYGETVTVSAGTWTEDLSLTFGVRLIGAGRDRTVLNGTIKAGNFGLLKGFTVQGGGGIRCNARTPLSAVIEDCTVRNSTMGIECAGCSPTIRRCIIHNIRGPGGIYLTTGHTKGRQRIENCLVYDVHGPAAVGIGMPPQKTTRQLDLVNCTVVNIKGTAKRPAVGIRYGHGDWGGLGQLRCTNMVVSDIDGYAFNVDRAQISYTCIYKTKGIRDEFHGGATSVIGPGMLTAKNPLFRDAEGADFRLRSYSPCRDAGTDIGIPAEDIDGGKRLRLDGCDLGVYEM